MYFLNRTWQIILYSCLWHISSETSTNLLWRDWKLVNLDCVPPAGSRPLFSSSSLFLRTGLKHHVGMYWKFTQTTMLMPNCLRQTLVKDHDFLVKPAYYLKSIYGVRGCCVCDISVVKEICTIKWILSLSKQNPTKPYRLRIWGIITIGRVQVTSCRWLTLTISKASLYWRTIRQQTSMGLGLLMVSS